MASGGLGQRLVDFVSAFMEPLTPPPAGRREPALDRHQLARQLLGTLSRDVLAETGHIKPRPAHAQPAPERDLGPDPRVTPQPPPVGDLARP